MKRGKEESKRYAETREALRLKLMKHKDNAAERLRKRLEARQCNPVAKTRQFDEVSSRHFLRNKGTGESKWENEGGRYLQYETDKGVAYYVPEGGGESVWRLPKNAEIVQ